jgi:hypothetical protein
MRYRKASVVCRLSDLSLEEPFMKSFIVAASGIAIVCTLVQIAWALEPNADEKLAARRWCSSGFLAFFDELLRGPKQEILGRLLMEKGMSVRIPVAPGASIIQYEKAANTK